MTNRQIADLERRLGAREEEIDRLPPGGHRLLHVLTLTSAYFYNVCSMPSKHAVTNLLIWTITYKLYIIYKGVTCHFNTAFLKLKTKMPKCLILMGHVKDLEGLEDFVGRNEMDMVFSGQLICQSWLFYRGCLSLLEHLSLACIPKRIDQPIIPCPSQPSPTISNCLHSVDNKDN